MNIFTRSFPIPVQAYNIYGPTLTYIELERADSEHVDCE